jgi:hypothetical protein
MQQATTIDGSRASSRMSLLRVFTAFLIFSLLVIPAGAFAAPEEAKENAPLTNKAIFFASDGMRPDLVDKYVGEGLMPTYQDLISTGVKGDKRPGSGLSAKYGCRLVHLGNRDLPGRAWLNQ